MCALTAAQRQWKEPHSDVLKLSSSDGWRWMDQIYLGPNKERSDAREAIKIQVHEIYSDSEMTREV